MPQLVFVFESKFIIENTMLAGSTINDIYCINQLGTYSILESKIPYN